MKEERSCQEHPRNNLKLGYDSVQTLVADSVFAFICITSTVGLTSLFLRFHYNNKLYFPMKSCHEDSVRDWNRAEIETVNYADFHADMRIMRIFVYGTV
eukprot:gene19105-biopygen5860